MLPQVIALVFLWLIGNEPDRRTSIQDNVLAFIPRAAAIFAVFALRVAYNLFDPRYFERSMSDPELEAVEPVDGAR